MPAIVRGQLGFARDRLLWAFGFGPRRGASPTWPTPVDSSFCRRAEEQARDLQSSSMLGHARRTFIFGSALAQLDGLDVDPELLYAGALLHDAGLEHAVPDECFTVRGAEALLEVATATDVSPERAEEAADAIVRHISPGLDRDVHRLGFYIQAGATADLAGVRLWELPRDLVARAMSEHPQDDVVGLVRRCWAHESEVVPKGRARFLSTYARFGDALRLGPRHG